MISRIGNFVPQKVTFGTLNPDGMGSGKDYKVTREEVDELILQAKKDVKEEVADACHHAGNASTGSASRALYDMSYILKGYSRPLF